MVTGEFLAIEFSSDFIPPDRLIPAMLCRSASFWPSRVQCVNGSITEVLCGDRFEEGPVLEQGVSSEFFVERK